MVISPLADALWTPSLDDLRLLGPLWGLIATIVAVLIAALLVGRNWRMSGAITILGALTTAALCARGLGSLDRSWGGMAPAGAAPMLLVDQFSLFFILLLSVFLALICGMWFLGQAANLPEKLARKQDAVEFFVLFVGSALGMAVMVSTTNLLMIVIAVEMASLPSYALAGFRKGHRLASEASVKYVLFGAVTSAIMVYGASLLYGRYQTLDLVRIGELIAQPTGQGGASILTGVALFGVMVGIAFKVSAVPFHFWCPDVFEGAAIEVTTWLSVASKAAGIGLMLRLISAVAASSGSVYGLRHISMAVGVMAAITATVGNFSAFRQTNLKRLLAFSSIAHAGYMLMAVAIVWYPADGRAGVVHPGFAVVAAYLVVYLFMNLGAFGVVAMVYWETGKETIDALNGLIRRQPLLAIAMICCLFSLIGLPPLGGFWAKWWLLGALWDAKLGWLVIVAVFNTLVSLYYYVRIIRAMTMTDDGQPEVRAPLLGQAAVLACALAVILTGTIWAGTLKGFADARSLNLYAMDHRATPIHKTAGASRLTPNAAAQTMPGVPPLSTNSGVPLLSSSGDGALPSAAGAKAPVPAFAKVAGSE